MHDLELVLSTGYYPHATLLIQPFARGKNVHMNVITGSGEGSGGRPGGSGGGSGGSGGKVIFFSTVISTRFNTRF